MAKTKQKRKKNRKRGHEVLLDQQVLKEHTIPAQLTLCFLNLFLRECNCCLLLFPLLVAVYISYGARTFGLKATGSLSSTSSVLVNIRSYKKVISQ